MQYHFDILLREMRSIRITQEGKLSVDGSSVNVKTYDFQFDKSFRSFNTNADVNKEVAQVIVLTQLQIHL